MNNKRREKIRNAIVHVEKANEIIEDVYSENEESRDNLPDNLYGSSLYDRLDEECDELNEIMSGIQDVV